MQIKLANSFFPRRPVFHDVGKLISCHRLKQEFLQRDLDTVMIQRIDFGTTTGSREQNLSKVINIQNY